MIVLAIILTIVLQYCGEFDNWGAVMSVSSELLCSFELLKPLDFNALKSHIKKGRNKRQHMLNSPVRCQKTASPDWIQANLAFNSLQTSILRVSRRCNRQVQGNSNEHTRISKQKKKRLPGVDTFIRAGRRQNTGGRPNNAARFNADRASITATRVSRYGERNGYSVSRHQKRTRATPGHPSSLIFCYERLRR